MADTSTSLKRKSNPFEKEIKITEKEEEDLFVDAPLDDDDDDDDDVDLEGDSEDEELEEEMTDSEESALSDEESDDDDDHDDSGGDDDDNDVEEKEHFDGDDEQDDEAENTKPKSKGKLTRLTQQLRQRRSHLQTSTKLDNETAPSQLTSTDDNAVKTGAETPTASKVVDEYEFDSSDEEDIRNTVGNIPMEWYDDYPHIGYDVKGQKILRPPKRDELEEFLEKMDNPDYWRTVHDKMTGRDIVLPDEDVALIQRIQDGRYPETTFDPYEPWVDFFTHEKMIHPVTRRPEHKRSFIPSLLEKDKVSKMLHSIRMGWLKPRKEKKDADDRPKFYDIWSNEALVELTKRHHSHIAAPKEKLPGHEESYRPPPEYLPTEEEIKEWKEAHPEDRKMDFIPLTFDCFRKVPAYRDYVRERFERCLDLYLCPRQRKMRVQVQPEDLLPTLPKPKDLQPFPTTQAVVYLGHQSYVRTISVDPTGQWLVSGSDDKTVRFWEVSSGRCMKKLDVDGTVKCVAWCPNTAVCLVAISVEEKVHLINPGLGDKLIVSDTDRLLESYEEPEEVKKSSLVEWTEASEEAKEKGFRLCLKHFKPTKQIAWHGKGDYFGTVVPDGGHSSVLIHQLSKRRSQTPFKKSKGLVQAISFHPSRPYFFVATQRFVRVYNLLKQELSKKLLTNAKWISSIAIHPGGDNVLVSSYDCRLSWFDMDLSVKPYKTLRHHRQAIRQVCYHRRYPLFASSGDDGLVIVCHGQVYNDLLQNAQIVPVKILRGHEVTNSLGVLACEFHPSQPWLFSSGADGTIRLFT
ncbi:ribosome biogenesis protein bop1-like [Patiria miniata]|uniref:Ribosome biogenesis protein BOP1 homolog n=1 Tax=Patiria miniata TaxID=46514 RepID=A0A914AWZ1_PATMI|nr:ribosome biogenesis protein bop1-like [Patiria miniata]